MDLKDLWQECLPELGTVVPFNLAKHVPLVLRVGSHAHGTYIPPEDEFGVDDTDLMVICIPPPEYTIGLKKFEHAEYKHGKLDIVFYDWGKYIQLLRKSNPNVIGTLWNDPEDVFAPCEGTPQMMSVNRLFWYRKQIISKKVLPAFVGYARSQLHKMTNFTHQGYMGRKRKELVEKFGFDTKNAAHLIRLLRMACETIETGQMKVRRPDAKDLIAIKSGQWSYAQVLEESERLLGLSDELMENTPLRDEPDDLLLQSCMVNGYLDWWNKR